MPPCYGLDFSDNIHHGKIASPQFLVGPVNDPYEQQADRLVGQIMGQSDNSDQANLINEPILPLRQKSQDQSVSAANNPENQVLEQVATEIEGALDTRQPLPNEVRKPAEKAFGRPLDDVHLHTGAQADWLNSTLGSAAFAVNKNIFATKEATDMNSLDAQATLLHETIHTLQQDTSGGFDASSSTIQRGRRGRKKKNERPEQHASTSSLSSDPASEQSVGEKAAGRKESRPRKATGRKKTARGKRSPLSSRKAELKDYYDNTWAKLNNEIEGLLDKWQHELRSLADSEQYKDDKKIKKAFENFKNPKNFWEEQTRLGTEEYEKLKNAKTIEEVESIDAHLWLTYVNALHQLNVIKTGAVKVFNDAFEVNKLDIGRLFFTMSLEAEQLIDRGKQRVKEKPAKDSSGTAFQAASTVNDVGGVGTGIMGGVLAGKELAMGVQAVGSIATISAVTGGLSLGLTGIFSVAAIMLSVEEKRGTKESLSQVKNVEKYLAEQEPERDDLKREAGFVKKRKKKKKKHLNIGIGLSTGAALATAFGAVVAIVTLAATAPGWGIAAAVAGALASLAGIGFLVYRGIRKVRSRKKQLEDLADNLVTEYKKGNKKGNKKVEQTLLKLFDENREPLDAEAEVLKEQTAEALRKKFKSVRAFVATELVTQLMNEDERRNQYYAAILIKSMGLDPLNIRRMDFENAVMVVQKEMNSW